MDTAENYLDKIYENCADLFCNYILLESYVKNFRALRQNYPRVFTARCEQLLENSAEQHTQEYRRLCRLLLRSLNET